MQLKDQAAIVTGGASGLGAATARRLAAQGGEPARGRRAQPRRATGDDGGLILQLHGSLPDEFIG